MIIGVMEKPAEIRLKAQRVKIVTAGLDVPFN